MPEGLRASAPKTARVTQKCASGPAHKGVFLIFLYIKYNTGANKAAHVTAPQGQNRRYLKSSRALSIS